MDSLIMLELGIEKNFSKPIKKIDNILKNNFLNHFFITQKIIKNFKKNKRKKSLSIVNIGSIVGLKDLKIYLHMHPLKALLMD